MSTAAIKRKKKNILLRIIKLKPYFLIGEKYTVKIGNEKYRKAIN